MKSSQIQTRKKYKSITDGNKANINKGPALTEVNIDAQLNPKTTMQTTISSDGKEEIIVYLEPANYEKVSVKHPVDVGKVLNGRQVIFTDIRAIGRFRFKITFTSVNEAKKLELANLEQDNLKTYIPIFFKEVVGIAKGIPMHYSEQELKNNIKADKEIIKVERLRRMGTEKKLVDTSSVKIIFKGKDLPDKVSLYGCYFKIELYLFPVKQCKNCWGFGHKTGDCKREKKCKTCGEKHDKEECQKEQCINCKGKHNADDRTCPARNKQQTISEIMQRERVTFQEAKNKLNTTNRFEVLSNYDTDFPEIATLAKRNSATQYKSVWSKPHVYRNLNPQTCRKNYPEFDKEEPHVFTDNPYKSGEMERTLKALDNFWRNINVIKRVVKLQTAVNTQLMTGNLTEISYEEVLLKISCSLNDIIDEFANELETLAKGSAGQHTEENLITENV